MFAVNNSAPDLGMGDDTQGGSLVSSISGPPRSDFENSAADSLTPREASYTSSVTNGKWPIKTPGVLRTGDAALMRNGSLRFRRRGRLQYRSEGGCSGCRAPRSCRMVSRNSENTMR